MTLIPIFDDLLCIYCRSASTHVGEGFLVAKNRSIGTSAIGGMLTGVLLGVFIIPVLFVIFQWIQEKFTGPPKQTDDAVSHLAE